MGSAPIHHSQARGIHPASFVQPAEPDTASLQDGTEWTDTSAGPPYVRKVWRASGARWDILQMDATGYPVPGGGRLDEVALDGSALVDPPAVPLTLSLGNAGDSSAPCAVQATYSFAGPSYGESSAAPVATATGDALLPNFRTVNFDLPGQSAPAGATEQYVYIRWGHGDPAAPTWDPWYRIYPEHVGSDGSLALPDDWNYGDEETGRFVQAAPLDGDQFSWACLAIAVKSFSFAGPMQTGGPVGYRTFLMAYSLVDAHGRSTQASRIGVVVDLALGTTPISGVSVVTGEESRGLFPAGAERVRWYINVTNVAESSDYMAGWRVAGEQVANGVAPGPFTASVQDMVAGAATSLPLHNGTCDPPQAWLRLADPSRQSWVRQNGAQIQLHANDADVLDLPLSTLSATPAALVGQDPATSLPAFCPTPKAALTTYVAPVQPVLPPLGTPAGNAACGAAHAMADRLARFYELATGCVKAALNILGPVAATLIIDAALDYFTAGTAGTWMSLNGDAYAAMKIALSGVLTAVEAGLMPALDGQGKTAIINTAYRAIGPAATLPITVTQATVDAWGVNMGADPGDFTGSQDIILQLLTHVLPLDQWQQEANTGSANPQSGCT